MSSRIIHEEQEPFQAHSWQPIHRSGIPSSSPPDGREFSPAGSSNSSGRRTAHASGTSANYEHEIREVLSREFQARLEQEKAAA
jgi:hypothetical protein